MVCICFALSAQSKKGKRISRKTQISTVDAEVKPKENTFKKYSLYFGIIKNQFSADPVEKWSELYSFFPQQKKYYTAQRLERHEFQIKGLNALNIGINKNVKLGKSFTLSYGLGMDLFTFSYDKMSEVLDLRVITEYEIIKDGLYIPQEVIKTEINPEIKNGSQNILSTNYEGPIEHRVIAITLPIMLRYEVIQNLYVSANAAFSSPIISRTIGEKYNFSTGRVYGVADEYDTNINRVLLNTGIGLDYHFLNKYSVGFNYKHYLNSVFSSAASESEYSNYRELRQVTLNSIEVRLGYHF